MWLHAGVWRKGKWIRGGGFASNCGRVFAVGGGGGSCKGVFEECLRLGTDTVHTSYSVVRKENNTTFKK